MRTTRHIALALALLVVPALAQPAFAQTKKQEQVETPTPGREDDTRPYATNMLLMIAIIAAVVGANCLPSKRGHQD